jgi:cyclopropane fatty-acyl-phospholipid synthase-like methyltransferase
MSNSPAGQRSNLEFWKEMQERGYFENHDFYEGGARADVGEIGNIEVFRPLTAGMKVVVIGCGYGRESAFIAKRVHHLYGIDVSDLILGKAVAYMSKAGVENFTPVLAEQYNEALPSDLDLVFSIVVMQHLTKDLVRDYFVRLRDKLKPGGSFIVQFLEDVIPENRQDDAQLKVYEPSVSWTIPELVALSKEADLDFAEIRTLLVTPIAVWHWVHFVRPAA